MQSVCGIGCDFVLAGHHYRIIIVIIQHSQLKKSSVAGVSRSSKKRIQHEMLRWLADSDSISINKSAGHWSSVSNLMFSPQLYKLVTTVLNSTDNPRKLN